MDVGKWEPFDSFAVSAPKDDAQKLLDYAAIITWPIFGKTRDGQNVFVKRWMWTVMESPVAFYAQVMSAAIHLQGNSANEAIQRGSAVASLFYKAKAIEALKDDIQHVSDAPDAGESPLKKSGAISPVQSVVACRHSRCNKVKILSG